MLTDLWGAPIYDEACEKKTASTADSLKMSLNEIFYRAMTRIDAFCEDLDITIPNPRDPRINVMVDLGNVHWKGQPLTRETYGPFIRALNASDIRSKTSKIGVHLTQGPIYVAGTIGAVGSVSFYFTSGALKTALNKFNVPEVLSQLFAALHAAGLDDTSKRLQQMGVTRLINDAWQNRRNPE